MNKTLKTIAIKFLSQHLSENFISKEILKKKYVDKKYIFKKGDQVYINQYRYNPTIKYYLVNSNYNQSKWTVSMTKDLRPLSTVFVVLTDNMSFEAPKICESCKQKIDV